MRGWVLVLDTVSAPLSLTNRDDLGQAKRTTSAAVPGRPICKEATGTRRMAKAWLSNVCSHAIMTVPD
jgi:hypothetical protein